MTDTFIKLICAQCAVHMAGLLTLGLSRKVITALEYILTLKENKTQFCIIS